MPPANLSHSARLSQSLGPRPAGRVVSVRGGGGSGGGANQDLIRQLMESFKSGSGDANSAANAQYRELMDYVTGLERDVMGDLAGVGKTEERRIGEDLTKNLASSQQSLMDRGLFNTTIKDTTERGIRSDAENARGDLAERLAMLRSGTRMDLGRLRSDSILSRDIQGPDQGMYLNLLTALAGG